MGDDPSAVRGELRGSLRGLLDLDSTTCCLRTASR